jgi:hypothetical protein
VGKATAEATATTPAEDRWAKLVKKSKTKAYTEAPVAMGDHLLIVQGHNDALAALEQGLTKAVIWGIMTAFLKQNMQDMGMVLKAVTMTGKEHTALHRFGKQEDVGQGEGQRQGSDCQDVDLRHTHRIRRGHGGCTGGQTTTHCGNI